MLKRISVLTLALLLILTSLGIGAVALAEGDRPVIGISLYYLRDEYYNALQNYFYKYAEEAGYDVIILDADTDPATQQGQIEDFIVRGVDVIALSAANPEASVVPIEEAVEAGIPVMTFDGSSASTETFTHVGFDSYEHGAVCGRYAARYIEENFDGSAQVAVIDYPQSADVAVKREQGFIDEVSKLEGVDIVSVQSGEMQRTKSMEVMENILSMYPDVKVCFGVTIETSAGISAAVTAAESDCVTMSVGWSREQFEEIEAGTSPFVMMATFTPQTMAKQVIDCITAYFNDETLEPQYLIGADEVSVDNIDTYPWQEGFEE